MRRRGQKPRSTSCCGIEPPDILHTIPIGPRRESGSNHRPGKTKEGSSHVNDATAVLFPRPPEPQTLLDDSDCYGGGLHPSTLACPGHDSRVRARVPPCVDSDPRHLV